MGRIRERRRNPNKEEKTAFSPAAFGAFWLLLLGFRLKMPVTEVMVFPDGTGFYVCPRCHVTMEREYMGFCDRCGQHLDWKDFRKARTVRPGRLDKFGEDTCTSIK